MKNLFFFSLFFLFVLQASAQTGLFTKKRSFKAEGYILNGSDTVKGLIIVPVTNDEVDFFSLSNRLSFIDNGGQQKNYKPNSITGFGFQESEDLGTYISAGKAEGLTEGRFLRKILEGRISLFHEQLDKYDIRDAIGNDGQVIKMKRKRAYHESPFYVRCNGVALVKITFSPKTGMLAKKDLKKVLDFLPDSFTDSKEEIDISGLTNIISDLNSNS